MLQATTLGMDFRNSKNLEARTHSLAPWGSIVRGIDEGDGWLKVGKLFLPMVLQGATTMTPVGSKGDTFLVDNTLLQSDTSVLGFCKDKVLDNQHDRLGPEWGEVVQSTDQGDGCLKIGKWFLPMWISGVPVVIPCKGNAAAAQSAVQPIPA